MFLDDGFTCSMFLTTITLLMCIVGLIVVICRAHYGSEYDSHAPHVYPGYPPYGKQRQSENTEQEKDQ